MSFDNIQIAASLLALVSAVIDRRYREKISRTQLLRTSPERAGDNDVWIVDVSREGARTCEVAGVWTAQDHATKS
jgi:hypothetical protein